MNYWEECIREALEDAKLEATADQVSTLVSWVEGAHENYGQATGADVASANWASDQCRALEAAHVETERERNKVPCKRWGCVDGWVTTYGGTMQSTSACDKCQGHGRHDP